MVEFPFRIIRIEPIVSFFFSMQGRFYPAVVGDVLVDLLQLCDIQQKCKMVQIPIFSDPVVVLWRNTYLVEPAIST